MISPPIETVGLWRCFGDDVAVANASLAVDAGEIHALVGLNGSGKTTLMRLMLGMLKPDEGDARIHGQDVRNRSTWADTGYLIESPFAYPELTVEENLAAAARLRGLGKGRTLSAVARSIHRFDLDRWAERRASALSLGNRQRLGIAAAVIHEPSVLILDEPANALDPAGVIFTRELLQELAAEGAAILVSSHHLDEVARVANTISVIHRGSIVGDLAPTEPKLERAFFQMALEWDSRNGADS